MARDYNGGTDNITYTSVADLNDRTAITVAMWVWFDAWPSPASAGSRLLVGSASGDTGGPFQIYAYEESGNFKASYASYCQASIASQVLVAYPGGGVRGNTGQWDHLIFTWNGGTTTSTDQDFYHNGASSTHVVDQNPTGTVVAATGVWTLGAHRLNDSYTLDGKLAGIGVWKGAVLDVGERAALVAGYDPRLIRPDKLIFAPPLIDDANDPLGATATLDGTTAYAHPPIIQPSAQILQFPSGPIITSVSTDDVVVSTENPWNITGARFGAR